MQPGLGPSGQQDWAHICTYIVTSSGSPRYQHWIWNVNESSLPFLSLPCLAYPCLALPFQGLFRLKMRFVNQSSCQKWDPLSCLGPKPIAC